MIFEVNRSHRERKTGRPCPVQFQSLEFAANHPADPKIRQREDTLAAPADPLAQRNFLEKHVPMHHRNTGLGAVLAMALVAVPGWTRADCPPGQTNSGGEVVGTLLGAAVGGLIGSQIGDGTGNKIAIGAGVLAGGLLGNRLGANLNCQDQRYHADTAQNAFETQRTGATSTWVNPDTGHAGSVTPTKTYQTGDGTNCRDFTQTLDVGGRQETGHGTACRQPDGTWRIVGTP
jgi:surface antigen